MFLAFLNETGPPTRAIRKPPVTRGLWHLSTREGGLRARLINPLGPVDLEQLAGGPGSRAQACA